MEYYIYVWRDAAQVPFYVGKGKGKRAYRVGNRSKEFKEIHAQGGCSVEIVDWFMHESQAHAHEVELIELYGRRDFGGTLVNKTDGGEGNSGWTPSDDVRAKISAKKKGVPVHSEESRAKMSAARKGQVISLEQREKLRIASTGKKHAAEVRQKMSTAKKGKPGRPRTENERTKLIAAVRFAPPRNLYKGVSYHKASGKWACRLRINGGYGHIGLFENQEEAARAYDAAAVDAWGLGNCYLNFPEEFNVKEAA